MIYFNNQLMPDSRSATLFMVTNTTAFERYEDHEAALFIHLHTLIEQALTQGEKPIALIEDYLELRYTEGTSIAEIADSIAQSDAMQMALWELKERWGSLDKSLPDDTLLYGGDIDKDSAVQHFCTITLRSYLEALAHDQNNDI